MDSLAAQLIEENKRTKEKFLDLGNCGLVNTLPDELFDCFWLEEVNFGTIYLDQDGRLALSKNRSGRNSFTGVEFERIGKLELLRKLHFVFTAISDISFLQNLTSLQQLNLTSNRISFFDKQLLVGWTHLRELYLKANPILNVLSTIYNQNECLADLRNFFKDSDKESLPLYESKIVLVGNGRVGKTCLLKRLLDKTFNPEEPSTHAIQLREWPLPQLAVETALQTIHLNIWDFGGQDIYHATHRLFLQTQALFVLVWDAETERMPLQPEKLSTGKNIRAYLKNSFY